VGDKISVRASPPAPGHHALGRELVRPDGTTVPLMMAPAPRRRSRRQADSIAGTWVPEGFFNFSAAAPAAAHRAGPGCP